MATGQQLSTNTFGEAKWVVSADATLGTHTTIATAITSAVSGDTIFIREGTYTENLTLKAGVNLVAYVGAAVANNSAGSKVIISGNATMSTAGTVSITGIQLATNGAAALTVSGSVASNVNLIDCDIEASVTAITFSSSSASASINLTKCNVNINTTGVALYSMTSPGTLNVFYCTVRNTGASTTASSSSTGSVNISWSNIAVPLATTSTGSIATNWCLLSTSAQNATTITTAGTVGLTDVMSNINSGSASAISIGTGTTVALQGTSVNSSNANAITGAGTLTLGNVLFTGTSATINPTTTSVYPGYLIDATTITLGGDANAGTINIASGAAAKNTNIGNTTSTSTLALKAGTNTTTPVYTVATNSGTIVSALGAGSINYPLTPAFLVKLGSDDNNKTGNGTVFTIGSATALTKIFDQGTNITTAGVFTAPVTGRYRVSAYTLLIGATVLTTGNMNMVTSNRTYEFFNGRATGTSASMSFTGSVLADFDAADTMTVTVTGNGEAGATDDVAGTSGSTERTWISGHLVA